MIELKERDTKEKTLTMKCEKMRAIGDIAKVQLIKMKREISQLQARLEDKEPFQKKKVEKAVEDYKLSLKRCFGLTPGSQKTLSLVDEADRKLTGMLSDPFEIEIEEITAEDIEDRQQLSFE